MLPTTAIDRDSYRQARRLLDETRSPQARRRSMLRRPEKHLREILARWHGP